MKITDLLMSEGIELNGKAQTKAEAIEKMVDLMAATGKLTDKEAYKAQVMKRKVKNQRKLRLNKKNKRKIKSKRHKYL